MGVTSRGFPRGATSAEDALDVTRRRKKAQFSVNAKLSDICSTEYCSLQVAEFGCRNHSYTPMYTLYR